MKFQGQLDDDVLVNLLQYLHLNRASGVLRLQNDRGSQGEIYAHEGQIVHAHSGGHKGLQALVNLLRWNGGRFAFQDAVASPERSLDLPLDALLLQAAYQTDITPDERDPLDGHSVLSARPLDAGGSARVALPIGAIRLLPLLDGITPLREIAARLGLPLRETLNAARLVLDHDLARQQLGRTVEQGFIHTLTDILRDIMGPLADIVMDEALYDLNLTPSTVPEAQLPALLDRLGQELERSDWREAFRERLRPLLTRYRLDDRV